MSTEPVLDIELQLGQIAMGSDGYIYFLCTDEDGNRVRIRVGSGLGAVKTIQGAVNEFTKTFH